MKIDKVSGTNGPKKGSALSGYIMDKKGGGGSTLSGYINCMVNIEDT